MKALQVSRRSNSSIYWVLFLALRLKDPFHLIAFANPCFDGTHFDTKNMV